jgi:hypothetical protein
VTASSRTADSGTQNGHARLGARTDPRTTDGGAVDAEQAVFWAGPALVSAGGPTPGRPIAVLALWKQRPCAADGPEDPSHLLERGFVRLAEATVERFRQLPLLSDATVRLTDRHDLRIDDAGQTLFEGTLEAPPEGWWSTAREGRITLLVDTAPEPGQQNPDVSGSGDDLNAYATARLVAAIRAQVLVGAQIEVVAA